MATVKKMNLMNVRDAEKCKGGINGDDSARLFDGFAHSALRSGLAVFHKTGRKCPESVTRFDGTAAEQNQTIMFGDTTDHDARIFIMNVSAASANMAW
jgi:hypothetical protein